LRTPCRARSLPSGYSLVSACNRRCESLAGLGWHGRRISHA
jgi:hypothetical protein